MPICPSLFHTLQKHQNLESSSSSRAKVLSFPSDDVPGYVLLWRTCQNQMTSFIQLCNKYTLYNLERRIHLMGLKGACLRVRADAGAFEEPDDLISQSSTSLGTQTSKRIWPKTPWALMLGRLDRWIKPSLCSFRTDPTFLPSWYSNELGEMKWSFNSSATLPKHSFELLVAFSGWQMELDVSSCISKLILSASSLRILWEYIIAAFSRSSVTAAL